MLLAALLACTHPAPPETVSDALREAEVDLRKHLEAAVRSEAPGEERPTVRLALAETLAREAEAADLAAMETYIASYDQCFDTPGCHPELLVPDRTAALAAWRKAGARYRQLLELDPDGPLAPDAAFGLAWSWRALGDDALGDAVLAWLVARHPDSAYHRDARLLRGEFDWAAYDQMPAPYDYRAAWIHGIGVYSEIAADPADPYRAFAAYRRGWLWRSVGEYGNAIDSLKGAIAMEQRWSPGEVRPISMSDDALRDLPLFFSDAGELDDCAYSFGCEGARPKVAVRELLARMAETYAAQGKFELAIQLWRRVASNDPNSPVAVQAQARIVDTYRLLGRSREVLAEADRLERLVAATTEPLPAEVDGAYEAAVRESAFTLHRMARQRQPELYVDALRLYAKHRSLWPDVRNTPAIAWGQAVALEESGQRTEARAAFQALLDAAPTGMYARDADAAVERLAP